jgi:uncharacterized damage-inducible protein DinB
MRNSYGLVESPILTIILKYEIYPLLEENRKLCLGYIEKTKSEEFLYTISYSNSTGYFESVISDCLIHLVNHATHHRGQIIKAIRDLEAV